MAGDILTEYLSNIHENTSVRDSGLFRSEVYPYLGASPDGVCNRNISFKLSWIRTSA